MRRLSRRILAVLITAATAAGAELSSDRASATFDAKGTLRTLGRDPATPLAELVGIEILDRTRALKVLDNTVTADKISPRGRSRLTVEKQSTALEIDYSFEYSAEDSLAATFVMANRTDDLRCMEIRYRFRLRDLGYEVFFPGEGDFDGFPEGGRAVASYIAGYVGKKLTIPFGTLYAKDAGMSFCAALDVPIQSFIFSAERKNGSVEVIVTRNRIRLEAKGRRSVTTHFVPHEGCWRPGLAFVRKHYPDLFTVKEGAERLQARSTSDSSLASYYPYNGLDEKFWQTYVTHSPWREGLSIPYMHAWSGSYYCDEEEWVPYVMRKWDDIHRNPGHYPEGFLEGKPAEDAGWREIVDWIDSREVDAKLFQRFRRTKGMSSGARTWARFSHRRVNEYLALAKKYGSLTMLYWNPSEVWDNWALDVFKGYEVPGWRWMDCTLCNIHPGSPVERTYWRNAKAIIDNYPDLTGLHVDQAYYGWEDRRRDDGFSIDERGPFSDLHRNIGRLVRKVTAYAHSKGKYSDQNHPYASIEVSGWCDLACVEDRCSPGMGQEPGRYITVGNRGCIQLYAREERMQMNLRNGWFTYLGVPPAALLDKEPRGSYCWRSWLYTPVFELFRGRTWVLEPNCVRLPEGYDGNLFKRPDGNYVATVISYGESITTPYWRVAVPVGIRIAEAARVKTAYLISADQLGPKKIDFTREGDAISIEVPRHKSASAILLGVEGRFVSIDRVSFREGREHLVSAVLDNLSGEPWTWGALVVYPWDAYKLEASVAPGATEKAVFYAGGQRAKASTHGHFRLRMHMDPGCVIPMPEEKERHIATFEIAEEGPVGFWLAPSMPLVRARQSNSRQGGDLPLWNVFPLRIEVGRTASFEAGLVNNTDEEITVKLTYRTGGCEAIDAPVGVRLGARECRSVPIAVKGTTPCAGELAVTVQATDVRRTDGRTFQVLGKALEERDLARVKSVSLIADLWGTTSKSKEKPVFLNNEEVGVLEGGGGYNVWHGRVRTELSEAASRALRLSNELRIENPKRDAFKIRHAMLEVETNDARFFLLRPDGRAKSTSKTEESDQAGTISYVDWVFSEGERVGPGEPMTFVIPAN